MTMTLLAYLAPKMTDKPELVATQALYFILSQSSIARSALTMFSRSLQPAMAEIASLHSEEHQEQGGRPDLVGRDKNGKPVLILEAKFTAGLTDNQPLGYLKRLPPGHPSLLLFVAPARRMILWNELMLRCKEGGVLPASMLLDMPEAKACLIATNHILALTSWSALLSDLSRAAKFASETSSADDLNQLAGLCQRMDSEAFVPLCAEDLSQELGALQVQFLDILDSVWQYTRQEGFAEVGGNWTGDQSWQVWRPLKRGQLRFYLCLSPARWAQFGPTPLWLHFDGYLSREQKEALSPLHAENPRRYFENDSGHTIIPIWLSIAEDKPQVIRNIFDQIVEVVGLVELAAKSNLSS